MPTTEELQQLAESGKQAFASKSYDAAARTFEQAARGYAERGEDLNAAEMKNNQSVALLKAGRFQQALTVVMGTESIFEKAGDKKRQGMALGNQAAALEAIKRPAEALELYERCAQLFAEAGEGDLRATVLQSAAALKLKQGQLAGSGLKMIGVLEAKDKPSLFERLLKLILRMKG